jgi:hypothetical protein
MGKFPLIILLFIFDFSLNSQSIRLEYGKLYSDEIKDNQIKYYHLPIQRDHESKIKGIKITSTLTKESNSKEKKVPIIIVSSQKLPNKNKESQWICGKIGNKECKVPNQFFKDTDNQNVNIAVFCNECSYSFKIDFEENENINYDETSNNQNQLRKLIALPQLRMTTGQNNANNRIGGYGIAGLIILFIIVITVIIACYVMMQIYVNTKLIAFPLKLGRVEG